MNAPIVTEEPTVKHASLTQALGLNHSDALIVVDVQRNFLPGGTLAIPQAVLGTLMADAQMVPIAAQARRSLRRAIDWI